MPNKETKSEKLRTYILSLSTPARAKDIALALGYQTSDQISSALTALAEKGAISHIGQLWGAPEPELKLTEAQLETIQIMYPNHSIRAIAKAIGCRKELISAAIAELDLENIPYVAQRRTAEPVAAPDVFARSRLARPNFFVEGDLTIKMRSGR